MISSEMESQIFDEKYLDLELCSAACRSCPSLAKTWICPPFECDWRGILLSFKYLRLYATRIVFDNVTPVSDPAATVRINNVMQQMHRHLHSEAKSMNGVAFMHLGECKLCGTEQCTRPSGLPCRHPADATPSLEAIGYNLSHAAKEILQIRLIWGKPDYYPPVMHILGCISHN